MLDLLLRDGDGTATALSQQMPVSRQGVAAQLASVGSAWDARLRRIKQVAETIQRGHPR